MDGIDTSKMTSGKAAALETAEAARETEWKNPSFMAEIFMGRFREELLWPFPAQSAEEEAVGGKLLEKTRDFLVKNVDPDRIDREQEMPEEVLRGLADLGLFGMKIPREYGGLGLSQVNYNRVISLTATHCASTAVWLSAHQSIGVPQPLMLFGTEEQKKKWLPKLAQGLVSGFALTEPDVGSDPARMASTAVPAPDGKSYLLNGVKLWCTNGLAADLLVVMACTPQRDPSKSGRKSITAFVVDAKSPGVKILSRCRFMGLHGIQNGLMKFTDVRVPSENILLGEGKGLKLALTTLNTGRLTLPAACAATARSSLGMARRWAAKRSQWGDPVGKHDAVAQKLSQMAASSFAMEAVSLYTAGLADSHQADIRLEAAAAKLFCSEAAWKIADDAVQVLGGRGYETAESLRERGETGYPLERMMRDQRINRIIEGTSEIMRLFIAREALDRHLKAAGSLVNPKRAGWKRLASDAVRAGIFYAIWYPKRWLPHGLPGTRSSWGKLGSHMAWISNSSNRLARRLFHLMIRFGPGLEKRQALLGRAVDIGTELFAASCACSYARHLGEKGRQDALILAERFCQGSRFRVETLFRELARNGDKENYRLARRVLEGEFAWMEEGIMPIEDYK